ncbi:MFS general substrate transporter [Lepidopterella palustris CBS 459.81]|uniref:MFS general substrate transporter n=1 Tax=Lepidopterella palustris CBS 459.81 TaxID=1314670 RepID=A0A8E2E2B1_9PEZI|nr:MFS general substrate transporter [Lepidopterella palustris CBS 459.81]
MASANYGYTSRSPVVLAVTTVMLVCSTVFVVLRLISRIGIVRRLGWNDYFMILAWFLAFATSFAICYGTSVGLGRHEADIPSEWASELRKSEYAFSALYNPALMATKTSILIFYLTLSKTQKIFRWATIVTLAVVNIGGLALTLLNVLQCRPVSAAFASPVSDEATCTDIVTIYLSSAPLNIITDLAILFLPMPILTSMRLPKNQKTILVITFGFGVFVAIIDVARIAYLQQAAKIRLQEIQDHESPRGGPFRNSETDDFSWYASLSFMWSAIEINVGIMCACVPALKPLVSRFMPRILCDGSQIQISMVNGGSMATLSALENVQRLPSISGSPPPNPPPASHSNCDGPVHVMDFLTTLDMNERPQCQRTNTLATIATNATAHTGRSNATFFDFVNVKKKKSMVEMNNHESLFPVLMVTVLFFIWGVAYGLLDILNGQFQAIADMSTGQSIGIHSAYFGGYLVAPLTFGRLVLKHWGFKACYIVGLLIYACGTLVFWPSAVLTSFPAFLISNFIVGLGLSTLEVSANPFIALCGPPKWSEVRLNISQGFQAIGSVVSPLLAKKVLFTLEADSLIDVQWTYLGISLFNVILAIGYYYVPLPEATDSELEKASSHIAAASNASLGNIKIIWITLGLGVFSQFCYVGGQETVSTSFPFFLALVYPSMNYVNLQAIGHTAFAVSRFIAALAGIFVKPRYLLLFFYAGAIAFAAAAMSGHGASPAAMVVMVYFFEGPIFSLIFGQCLRGMGRNTKYASVLLTTAIGGGAVTPLISYGAGQARNVQYAYCVVVAAFAFGLLLPIWLNVVPGVKAIVDPMGAKGKKKRKIEKEDAVGVVSVSLEEIT